MAPHIISFIKFRKIQYIALYCALTTPGLNRYLFLIGTYENERFENVVLIGTLPCGATCFSREKHVADTFCSLMPRNKCFSWETQNVSCCETHVSQLRHRDENSLSLCLVSCPLATRNAWKSPPMFILFTLVLFRESQFNIIDIYKPTYTYR